MLAISQPAFAQPRPPRACADGDWVQIGFDVPDNSVWAISVRERLRAQLLPNHIGVCTSAQDSTEPPLARVRIAHSTSHQVALEVQVEDAVTKKSVARQLDLTGMPNDTHAPTIALGVAELLRASWAELNLRRTLHDDQPIPPSVKRSLDDYTLRPANRASLSVHLAGEEFMHGYRQVGADMRFGYRLHGPWLATGQLGVRQGPNASTADGSARAQGFKAGVGSAFTLASAEAVAALALAARFDWAHVDVSAQPRPDATGTAGTSDIYLASAGVLANICLGSSLQFDLQVDIGSVIRGVHALDAGREVLALDGAWLGVATGIGVLFW